MLLKYDTRAEAAQALVGFYMKGYDVDLIDGGKTLKVPGLDSLDDVPDLAVPAEAPRLERHLTKDGMSVHQEEEPQEEEGEQVAEVTEKELEDEDLIGTTPEPESELSEDVVAFVHDSTEAEIIEALEAGVITKAQVHQAELAGKARKGVLAISNKET